MKEEPLQRGASYAAAGIDVDAANRFVERVKQVALGASRPEVLAGVGPFSALFALGHYREPVLVSSTDGAGTKIILARILGRFLTIGRDLVNLCINDILTSGAEPLFFLDYIASNGLDDEARLDLVKGMAEACAANGCALVGGETADMPGVYAPGDYDVAGFVVGVVERDAIIDGHGIRPGDLLFGLPSTGLHTNGYSLVRRIWGIDGAANLEQARAILEQEYVELDGSLGNALLQPHPSYLRQVQPVLPLLAGIAHITGGGLIDNVPRILPDGLTARFQVESWPRPPIFDLIQGTGRVEDQEMYRTFNMGLGLVMVVHPEHREAVRRLAPAAIELGAVETRASGGAAVLLD